MTDIVDLNREVQNAVAAEDKAWNGLTDMLFHRVRLPNPPPPSPLSRCCERSDCRMYQLVAGILQVQLELHVRAEQACRTRSMYGRHGFA